MAESYVGIRFRSVEEAQEDITPHDPASNMPKGNDNADADDEGGVDEDAELEDEDDEVSDGQQGDLNEDYGGTLSDDEVDAGLREPDPEHDFKSRSARTQSCDAPDDSAAASPDAHNAVPTRTPSSRVKKYFYGETD